MTGYVLVRGGGDLGSGAVVRLARAGIRALVLEAAQPLAVRRKVAFAEAVYTGESEVEELRAVRVVNVSEIQNAWRQGWVPVMVDPQAEIRGELPPVAIVDARMTKRPPELGLDAAPLVIGLGPGFVAGENCHAVVETMRGPDLGRVLWNGSAASDTGLPDPVWLHQADRVLRAPCSGRFQARVEIGQRVQEGQVVAEVDGQPVRTVFSGVVRGLLHSGLDVQKGLKVGDIDPRDDPRLAYLVSDKALAVGGGVLEAVLARREIRAQLWE